MHTNTNTFCTHSELKKGLIPGSGVPTTTSDATQGRSAGNYMENSQVENGDKKEVLKKGEDKSKHTLPMLDIAKRLFTQIMKR